MNYDARQGMYVHPTLVVTPEGVAMGVTDSWMRCPEPVEGWARKPKGEADFKESLRWVEGYARVAEMAACVPDTRLVYIADREGDFRELFDKGHELGYPADILVRAVHERNTADGGKLWRGVEQSEALGDASTSSAHRIELVLPAGKDRSARKVCQTLYRQRVTLPAHGKSPAIELTALLAREENPPAGEKPLVWRLLTNRHAKTLKDAAELIEWYRRRWLIEIFFRIPSTSSGQASKAAARSKLCS